MEEVMDKTDYAKEGHIMNIKTFTFTYTNNATN
jgi:hypothetical protein